MVLKLRTAMNALERNHFFAKLLDKCEEYKVYSVIDTAEAMGISYSQVKKWASSTKKCSRILQKCKKLCARNAQYAYDNATTPDEAKNLWPYLLENISDEEALKAEAQQEKKEKLKQQIKEREKEHRKRIAFDLTPSDKKPSEKALIEQNKLVRQLMEQKQSVEQERLNQWKDKNVQESLSYSILKNESKSTDDSIHIESKFNEQNLTPWQEQNIKQANLCAATGCANKAAAKLLSQTASGVFRNNYQDAADMISTVHEMLIAMKPNDIQEGMLCARLVVLQDQYMTFLRRSADLDQTTEGIDLNINRSTKLMRLYNETLDTLNRYRRKGEQKVTVQHVNVNDGGKAVVAGELHGGRGNDKK